jgi:large subunit ribosomal protein L31
MQDKIHPQWYDDAVVTCSCGNTFTTGATLPEIKIDICSACHPFFTGEMKFVDRQGRVDKFKKKMQKAKQKQAAAKQQQKQADQTDDQEQKTYQEILREKQAELRQSDKKTDQATASTKETKK